MNMVLRDDHRKNWKICICGSKLYQLVFTKSASRHPINMKYCEVCDKVYRVNLVEENIQGVDINGNKEITSANCHA